MTKQLRWHDTVLHFAPKPLSRRLSAQRTASSTPTDDSMAAAGRSSPDSSRFTDEDQEQFYDAVTDLSCGDKESPSSGVKKIIPSQRVESASGASAGSETSSKDVSGVSIAEKAIVFQDPSPRTSCQASLLTADVISDANSPLTDAKDQQKREVITREISTLPAAKLKMLQKLIKKKKVCKHCSVKVDLEYKTVTLKGTEEDVMKTETAVYEALANAGECCLNISKALGHLITSPKGQQWFDDGCERGSFLGICYVDSSVTKLLAADDAGADDMKKWLSDALHSESVSFTPHQMPFLQTREWLDFVRKLTDSQLLVVTEDASEMVVLVEGLMDAVKTAVKEIVDLLNRLCRINKELPLKPADFRTLSFHCTQIVNKVQELR